MDGYAIPIGKQTRQQSHIFYTPCTGIWQSVWLEKVPETYVEKLDIAAGADGQGKSFKTCGLKERLGINILHYSQRNRLELV